MKQGLITMALQLICMACGFYIGVTIAGKECDHKQGVTFTKEELVSIYKMAHSGGRMTEKGLNTWDKDSIFITDLYFKD